MTIIHPIDDFFFELFPAAKGKSDTEIVDEIRKYYALVGFQPGVSLKEGFVVVEMDAGFDQKEEGDFNRAVSLCEAGKFSDAKPILLQLIGKNPANSEYHRILGQVYSEQGDQDEAINSLIDALRWNPKNGWALLLMGNIFGKFRNDVATAMNYYDQAMKVNPDDYISAINIGVFLLSEGKTVEAKKYLEKALEINDKFPNAHLLAGRIAEMENNLTAAFDSTITGP